MNILRFQYINCPCLSVSISCLFNKVVSIGIKVRLAEAMARSSTYPMEFDIMIASNNEPEHLISSQWASYKLTNDT